jgi:hypothetical protein
LDFFEGCAITVTGWTFEYLDEMEFPDIISLMDHWTDYPPTHLLARAYLDYRPPMRDRPGPEKQAPTPTSGKMKYTPESLARLPKHIREAIIDRDAKELAERNKANKNG